MTRKRYIKLLMAHDFDRNEAVALAADVAACGWSYEEAYEPYSLLFAGYSQEDFERVFEMLRRVSTKTE